MQASERRDASSSRTALVFGLIGAVLVLAAFVVASVSISGSSDSPCGSIFDDRADWVTESSCGIAHLGQLVVVVALGTAGAVAALSALRVRFHPGKEQLFVGFLLCALLLGAIGTAALAWRAATYDEPVLKRGWVAVRDVSGYATIGLGLATVVAAAATALQRRGRAGSAPTN